MPTYDYNCDKCNKEFDIIKSIHEYDTEEKCPKCQTVGIKLVSRNIFFTGTKIEDAEYNPGLGAVTKSKKHREELVKRKDLIEIGTEKPETIHKIHDTAREEKRKKSWDDIF